VIFGDVLCFIFCRWASLWFTAERTTDDGAAIRGQLMLYSAGRLCLTAQNSAPQNVGCSAKCLAVASGDSVSLQRKALDVRRKHPCIRDSQPLFTTIDDARVELELLDGWRCNK